MHAPLAGTLTVANDVLLQEEYAQWLQEQEEVVQDLKEALQLQNHELGNKTSRSDDHEQKLAHAVRRAVQNFHSYYQPTDNVVSPARKYALLAGPVVSAVERVFMWMGGQRPSTTFQLLYALMGHQIEVELEELLELDSTGRAEAGRPPASLASLSASQLTRLNELQTETIREEDRIQAEMADLQQSLGGRPTLLSSRGSGPISDKPAADTISNVFARRGGINVNHESSSSSARTSDNSDIVEEDSSSSLFWNEKLTRLQQLCMQADSLRLSTLDRVVELLHTPFQKAQFLLAAAKFQVALRKTGRTNNINIPPTTPRAKKRTRITQRRERQGKKHRYHAQAEQKTVRIVRIYKRVAIGRSYTTQAGLQTSHTDTRSRAGIYFNVLGTVLVQRESTGMDEHERARKAYD